ncbi:DNA endonuclease RBBP8 [Periophthalmus magnuspinnatus]|uniref:DNA endonuclease RBBP8 n=1 Tax=Periophthalmus magnuspinnatus TaxID=409849 RepID=UPI0024370C1F|nr:DNA endonuclease RBBP8 [Periophthalmus magnuspinnatus]
MSSDPVPSSDRTEPGVNFEDLWQQLRECHQNTLQELEAKVAKLKKERCLDAQRLEQFFNRNQQLKEQNKNLQEAVSGLEERLRDGECERCIILEDGLKNTEQHNAVLIDHLKQEKKALKDDNKKLTAELEKLKAASSDRPRTSSPEPDDCVIPDSPVMASSLPAANKLKKRKNIEKAKFVRYVEKPIPPPAAAHTSLFVEAEKDPDVFQNPVLVPNTCELEASQPEGDVNSEEVIAETCRLLLPRRVKKESPLNQRNSPESSLKYDQINTRSLSCSLAEVRKNHSPDSTTDRSLSLLPRNKRVSVFDFSSGNKAKRTKEEMKVSRTVQPKLDPSTRLNGSRKPVSKSESTEDATLTEKSNMASLSSSFKKPNATVKHRISLQDGIKWSQTDTEKSPREFKVEPMWSMDPALALEMYETEQETDEVNEEKFRPGDFVDSDCTWISHSVLQRRAENEDDDTDVNGLGEKANDSLDRMFETSACGDYKSYATLPTDDRDKDQDRDHDQDHDHTSDPEEEEEEEEGGNENDAENGERRRKSGAPAFPHVAVIRKKEERRKLKGTTCKECEIYYAHLPEEERQKKLSNCSRHRFLYIPPCTPENFWEVGFPSTQTCKERGYIKEDENPQSRLRRRQPLKALFSPKGKKQED